MKNVVLIAAAILYILVAEASQLPAGFAEQLIAQNLDPTDMVIGPDGRIFITFKSGQIRVFENGILKADPFFTIEVDNYNERGLGHMALDPNFETNHFFYVYYTVKNENHNRVSRFTANGDYFLPTSEKILLELDALSGTIHNAGDLVFGPDGKLYISVGDGSSPQSAQSFTSLLGKVLRINPDPNNLIPIDNPFISSTTGKYQAIWALGFRNPFSMDIQPTTGKVFVSEVGQETWEEVNDVQAGKNYGWPTIEGKIVAQIPPLNYIDPIYAYRHGTGANQGCAVVGAMFYNPIQKQFPDEYVGKFFFADYCNGYIAYIDPTTAEVKTFSTGVTRPLAMVVAPDGTMYYLARAGIGGGSEADNTSTTSGTLWKVNYTGSGIPTIASQPKDVTSPIGDDVEFIFTASGNQPLKYQWQKNGVAITGATNATYVFKNVQLSDNGNKLKCIVSNALGSATTAEVILKVTNNTRPVPSLTAALPNNAEFYQAGQTISFSGSAIDAEDGILANAKLSWKIDFHHEEHSHPAMASISGISSGTYVIPRIGEADDDVWYRVLLTATDKDGLTKTIYKDLFPQKVQFILQSEPSGLTLLLDGQSVTTPATVDGVVGVTRTIEGPVSQTSSSKFYVFNAWTEAGLPRQYSFDTPTASKTFKANYTLVPLGDGNGFIGTYYTNQKRTFDGPVTFARRDPKIDFSWGGGSPNAVITKDNFTAKWVGDLTPPLTDDYIIYLASDDGSRLSIDGNLVLNQWVPQAVKEVSFPIKLNAGQKYGLVIEYFEDAGDAVIKLSWSSKLLPKQIIPTSQISSGIITGLQENQLEEVQVYPIPADDKLVIKSKSNWKIYNSMGQLVTSGVNQSEETTLSVSEWPKGIYILKTDELKTVRFSKR
jgi:glucose/arabinose dehydrogenase